MTLSTNYDVIKDVESLGYKLERFHGLFYSLWSISGISCSDKIQTAGIVWNKESKQINMLINPDFWRSLNEHTKLFVLCHEMLHVFLYHPQRTKQLKLDRVRANIAQDVCINEMLVNNFAFVRNDLTIGEWLCWLDTVPFKSTPQPDREFEYYYNLLKNGEGNLPQLVDDHGGWNFPDNIGDIIKDAMGNMEVEELEDLSKRINSDGNGGNKAGTEGDLSEVIKFKKNVTRSNRWHKIFKHWTEAIDSVKEDWLRKNRRLASLHNSKFILPCDYEKEDKKEKAKIYLFLDTSGSCRDMAGDFYDAANSIPKKYFDVKMFGFTTSVYPIVNNELKGFGGTYFHIIEDFLAKEKTYPTAVFVITDGEGDRVYPKHPDRWYWFLSKHHSKHFIDPKSHSFLIDNLEKV